MFKLLDIRSKGRQTLALTLCAAALALAVVPSKAENTIRVELDYARVIKLDRPVSRVIVGNADIADATVSDSQTIILTGKSFGTTNLVILDDDGNAIVDERVLVSLEAHNTMQVYRETERKVLSCTPSCEELDLE
ncbi:pilus assembly protein N-terminal domain-containing protein [Nitratireductor sp. XY-223]|uniref:pilus assembly protein N-terminal domain-containing protein n=1 Tax=Nitratireductor sp. XY-223 TaxID=2561926 RepID=UPI0010AAF589|nr:pilus assembly protein N-terminal domain-containing protein [Nitratireductor sp. XY-223]